MNAIHNLEVWKQSEVEEIPGRKERKIGSLHIMGDIDAEQAFNAVFITDNIQKLLLVCRSRSNRSYDRQKATLYQLHAHPSVVINLFFFKNSCRPLPMRHWI